MGWVYLIGEKGNEGRYKIGSTRAKNVNKRLKQLQTGNSSELFIKESYETDYPFKLEKMLHNRFKSSSLIGEWFELSEADIKAFKDICDDKSRIIEELKGNPFFLKADITPSKMDNYTQEELSSQIEEITNEVNKSILNTIKGNY